MDAAAINVIGTVGGPLAVLALILIYLLRQNHNDRKQYRDEIARIESRHLDETKEAERRHSDALTEVKNQLAGLKDEVTSLLKKYDNERRARWRAEDQAAIYRRRLGLPDTDPEGESDHAELDV